MILLDGRPVTLTAALDLLRAQCGVAAGEPIFTTEHHLDLPLNG